MEIIESINNERIKKIAKLKEKKYRDIENLFLIEGMHLINEAYKSNQLVEVFALKDLKIDLDIDITYVTENVIKKLSDLENTKIVGVCKKFKPLTYGKRIIVLDNLQDPGNLGTIIRSAAAFNIDTIMLINNTVDLYNSKVIRATQGLLFYIDVMQQDINILNELKENDYKLFGTDVSFGNPANKINYGDKFAIIIGNEGNGISTTTKELIDEFIYIPMNHRCESLNASVAASIIMYEISKVDYE